MANIIKPKRSSVAAKVPTTSDLVSGEIGVNMTDKKIYINNGGAITQIGAGVLSALDDVVITSPSNGQSLVYNGTDWVNQSGSGSGDVSGPASSTDNAITRFDGTTGKTIQNSTVTINDDGTIGAVNGIEFDITPTNPPTAIGSMAWDTGDGTPYVVLDTDVSLQLGQENVAKVYNGSGATIAKGKVVAVSGAQGQRPSVVLADADSEPYSAATLGITTEDIADGAEGFVTTFGLIRGIDTSAFTAGNPIWLSQTAGEFTATKPNAPAHLVFLGWIIKVNASSGEVFVHISNGWELDELHNVLITSPQSGNTLIYDAVAGVWENANLTDGTGISITEGAGSITITNTAPDQVVSLTQGGATTITGTYPSFTISSVDTTYSLATSTTLGLIELGSDTVQTEAAQAVTSTASRTYALQVNSSGQGVVNVPWTAGGTGTVTSVAISGTNISVDSGSPITTSGTIALSIPQAVGTTSSVQFGSFGVGTAASGTTGEIRATNNVTAYFTSDNKYKINIKDIPNATEKVCAIGGKTFDWTDDYIEQHGGEDGYFVSKNDFGHIAQDVQKVFPLAVKQRADGSLALDYVKLSALAFAAISEMSKRIEDLEKKLKG